MKVKTKFIWLIGILLVATLVTAQVLNNRNSEVTREQYDALPFKTYGTTDTLYERVVERCLLNETKNPDETIKFRMNSCGQVQRYERICLDRNETRLYFCQNIEEREKNSTQLRNELNEWEDKQIISIANAYLNRSARNPQITGTGNTTITIR